MINLILKDVLVQKKTLALMALYILIFAFAFQNIGPGAFPAIAIAVTYQLVATASNHEEKSNSDIVLNSLPVRRSVIVLSKYLSVLLYLSMATLGYMALAAIIGISGVSIKIQPATIEGIGAAIVGIMLMNGIYYPVYFKWGYVKAKMISFILFFAFFFGTMALMEKMARITGTGTIQSILGFLSQFNNTQVFILLVGIASIISMISYLLSVKFYNSREF